jgi:hypothetical protein
VDSSGSEYGVFVCCCAQENEAAIFLNQLSKRQILTEGSASRCFIGFCLGNGGGGIKEITIKPKQN